MSAAAAYLSGVLTGLVLAFGFVVQTSAWWQRRRLRSFMRHLLDVPPSRRTSLAIRRMPSSRAHDRDCPYDPESIHPMSDFCTCPPAKEN